MRRWSHATGYLRGELTARPMQTSFARRSPQLEVNRQPNYSSPSAETSRSRIVASTWTLLGSRYVCLSLSRANDDQASPGHWCSVQFSDCPAVRYSHCPDTRMPEDCAIGHKGITRRSHLSHRFLPACTVETPDTIACPFSARLVATHGSAGLIPRAATWNPR
jgi:hypothetical protein